MIDDIGKIVGIRQTAKWKIDHRDYKYEQIYRHKIYRTHTHTQKTDHTAFSNKNKRGKTETTRHDDERAAKKKYWKIFGVFEKQFGREMNERGAALTEPNDDNVAYD